MVVLGHGKLGAQELNLSSDIDRILLPRLAKPKAATQACHQSGIFIRGERA